MRLTAVIIFLLIVQMGILLFDNTYSISDLNDPYTNTSWTEHSYGVGNATATTPSGSLLWKAMVNPVPYSNTEFLVKLLAIFGAITLVTAAIFIGLAIAGIKTDLIYKVPLATFFFSVGAVPIIQLYNLIIRETAMYGCAAGAVCPVATVVAFFMSGMLFVVLLFSILSWWTGVDSG